MLHTHKRTVRIEVAVNRYDSKFEWDLLQWKLERAAEDIVAKESNSRNVVVGITTVYPHMLATFMAVWGAGLGVLLSSVIG